MKPIRKIHILTVPLIVLAVAGGLAWIFREEMLQHLVRPWVEEMSGSALDAEIRIGRLTPVEGGLLFTDLSMSREDGSLFAVIPELGIGFTLAGLLHKKLESMVLLRPDIFLSPDGEEKPLSFPERSPFEVGFLKVRDGEFRIGTPSGPILLHGIEVGAGGTESIDFRLTGFAGEGIDQPILLEGDLRWREGLFLNLEKFHWQETSLLESPLALRFSTEEEGSAEGVFHLGRLDSRQIESAFTALQREFPLPQEILFTLFSLRVEFRWNEGGLHLRGAFERGIFQEDDRSILLGQNSWMLAKKNRNWEFESRFALAEKTSGRIKGTFSEGNIHGDLHLRIPDPDEFIVKFAQSGFPPTTEGLDIRGEFSISGSDFSFEGSFEGMPGKTRPDYLLSFSPLYGPLVVTWEGESWFARVGVWMDGMEIGEARAEGGQIELAIIPVSGRTLHTFLGPGYRMAIPAGTERVRAELLFTLDKHWNGAAEIVAERVPLPKGVLEQVRFSGRFHAADGSIRFTRLDMLSRLAGQGVPNGELSASGSGEWKEGKWLLRFDSLAADGMDYLAPGGDSGFAGARLQSMGTVSGTTGGDSIDLDLSGTLSLQELLYGTFYAELSDMPGRWTLRGTYEPGEAIFRAGHLSFAVENLGRLHLEGRITPAMIRTRGRIRLEQLGAGFSRRFLPALRERFAAVKDLRLSGAAAAEFALDAGSDGWHARGDVLPEGLDISQGFLSAGNLAGSFPFDLYSGDQRSETVEKKRSGTLSFSSFSLGPAHFEEEVLETVSYPNRFEIPGSASFRLAKGRLQVEGASFALGEAGPEFSAKIGIREIDLEVLTGELGWVQMAGRLDADLGRIDYADDTLTSEGNMVIEVFDGIVLVSGIRLEAPFSAYPLVFGDLDFSGIDLFQITRAFSFGAINGIADGFIHDLRLFRLTPSRFEAVLQTRNDGTRNISVKALENLTIISGGGLSTALSRGIFRFIDFYRYRKIGIWCILRQDVFVLRGTAREDSQRYLIYGGLMPPKIDILAPEHAISFKEMLKRLQRIDRAEGPDAESD